MSFVILCDTRVTPYFLLIENWLKKIGVSNICVYHLFPCKIHSCEEVIQLAYGTLIRGSSLVPEIIQSLLQSKLKKITIWSLQYWCNLKPNKTNILSRIFTIIKIFDIFYKPVSEYVEGCIEAYYFPGNQLVTWT